LVTANTTVKKVARARLMSRAEVLEVVPFTYTSIWKMMRAGTFPRGREIAGKICWLESEIEQWIAERPVKALRGEPGAKPWWTPRRLQRKRDAERRLINKEEPRER
jgi:prophage regulatory protein